MILKTKEIILTTFSFIFLITTIILYIYRKLSNFKIIFISILLTIIFNAISGFLYIIEAIKYKSGSIEINTRIAFACIHLIIALCLLIFLLVIM